MKALSGGVQLGTWLRANRPLRRGPSTCEASPPRSMGPFPVSSHSGCRSGKAWITRSNLSDPRALPFFTAFPRRPLEKPVRRLKSRSEIPTKARYWARRAAAVDGSMAMSFAYVVQTPHQCTSNSSIHLTLLRIPYRGACSGKVRQGKWIHTIAPYPQHDAHSYGSVNSMCSGRNGVEVFALR